MTHIQGCQIPGYSRVADGEVMMENQTPIQRFKRHFARPWNYTVKPRIKWMVRKMNAMQKQVQKRNASMLVLEEARPVVHLHAGDMVLVREKKEIEATLDRFHELKGCAFLEYMWMYCGTVQRVLQPVERFLDERDYKVKKAHGVVLLEGVLCHGTPVFGRCDRCCHLFWREEWLEKLEK